MSEQGESTFTLGRYLRDRLALVVLWLLCALAVYGFALVLGVTLGGAGVLSGLVLLSCVAATCWDYLRRRSYYNDLAQAIEQLDKVRYLSAYVSEPRFLEERLSWEAS